MPPPTPERSPRCGANAIEPWPQRSPPTGAPACSKPRCGTPSAPAARDRTRRSVGSARELESARRRAKARASAHARPERRGRRPGWAMAPADPAADRRAAAGRRSVPAVSGPPRDPVRADGAGAAELRVRIWPDDIGVALPPGDLTAEERAAGEPTGRARADAATTPARRGASASATRARGRPSPRATARIAPDTSSARRVRRLWTDRGEPPAPLPLVPPHGGPVDRAAHRARRGPA